MMRSNMLVSTTTFWRPQFVLVVCLGLSQFAGGCLSGREGMTVGFFHDERCLWHSGGNYALTMGAEHAQPSARVNAFVSGLITEMTEAL